MKRKLQISLLALLPLMGGGNLAFAGDFIDDATTIKVANTPTSATSGDKKTLTFTPTGAETAIEFTFSSGKAITPGQIFGVVEYSGTGTNTGNCRFRNFTIGGTALEEGTKAGQLPFTVNGNTVVLCPFLQNDVNNADKVLKTYYKTNVDAASLSLTYCRMYVGATASTAVTFNRIGIYTLGEILTLYPDLKTNNFQINDQYRLLNDESLAVTVGETKITASNTNNGTNNGSIQSKGSTAITTAAGVKLFCKAIDFAKLPDNYRYFHFRYLQPAEGEILREDVFAGINEQALLLLPSQLGANYVQRMPTWHKKINTFDNNTNMYVFTDGVAPSSFVTNAAKSSQDSPGNWSTYTRVLKAGYNSCAMPFKKLSEAHEAAAGLTFYKVSSLANSGTAVEFTKIADPTANNTFTNGITGGWTPVIIKAEHDGLYTFVGRDAVTDWSGIGSYEAKTVGSSGEKVFWVGSFINEEPTDTYASTVNYGITADGTSFAKMGSGVKTTYYRAFLADDRKSGARALTLSFDNGDGTTDIVQLSDVDGMEQSHGAVYNLQGIRMQNDLLPRGIYVKNGKKFVVK